MQSSEHTTYEHPFPRIRPALHLAESDEIIDEVDCCELQWWFVIPTLSSQTMSASYEIDTQELSTVTNLVATRPAMIHQMDCVEIQVSRWSMPQDAPDASAPKVFYSKLEPTQTRWLGVIQAAAGKPLLSTFLDKGFAQSWGTGERRRLYDDGRYQRQPDGSYKLTDGQGLGAGVYQVTIGARTFCCLRVLDVSPTPSEYDEIAEAFVERSGRTILYRQYRGRLCGAGNLDWVEVYPNNARLVIHDCVYVHCDCTGRAHDVITNTSIGVRL